MVIFSFTCHLLECVPVLCSLHLLDVETDNRDVFSSHFFITLTLWAFHFQLAWYGQGESRRWLHSCYLYFFHKLPDYAKHHNFSREVRHLGQIQGSHCNMGCLRRTESGQSQHLYAPAPFGLCVKGLSRFFQPGTNPPLQSAVCRPLPLIQSCTVS